MVLLPVTQPYVNADGDPRCGKCRHGPNVDEVMKSRSVTRYTLDVVAHGESRIIQPLVNFGTCIASLALTCKSMSKALSLT